MATNRQGRVAGDVSSGVVDFLTAVGGCVVVLGLLVYGVLATGWVLTVLWGWFVEQTFHLPSLLLPVAVGMAAMVRLLTNVNTSNLEQKELSSEDRWIALVAALTGPWAILLLGWIAHLFV